jgi:hypothetical protein
MVTLELTSSDFNVFHVLCSFIFWIVGTIITIQSTYKDNPRHEIPCLPFPQVLLGLVSTIQMLVLVSLSVILDKNDSIALVGPVIVSLDSAIATLIGVSLILGDPRCDDIHVFRMLVAFLIYSLIRWLIFAGIIHFKLNAYPQKK